MRKPRSETIQKVEEYLKSKVQAVSAYDIQKGARVDYLSVEACVSILIKQRKVGVFSTSAGSFYYSMKNAGQLKSVEGNVLKSIGNPDLGGKD